MERSVFDRNDVSFLEKTTFLRYDLGVWWRMTTTRLLNRREQFCSTSLDTALSATTDWTDQIQKNNVKQHELKLTGKLLCDFNICNHTFKERQMHRIKHSEATTATTNNIIKDNRFFSLTFFSFFVRFLYC